MTPRIGRFTSSQILRLLSYGKRKMTAEELKARPKEGEGSAAKYTEDRTQFGETALTYIAEKRMERKAQVLLGAESFSKETAWGKLLEPRVFELLGTDYKPTGTDTAILHPKHPDYWCGTPDGQKFQITTPVAVAEVKCPFTRKSFFTFAECKDIAEVREKHPDGEKYYWQCVSNAAILDVTKAELIIYCPYLSEAQEIQELASECEYDNIRRWMERVDTTELPFLNEGGEYKNMYIFSFDIPQEDIERIEDAVKRASVEITKPQNQ